MGYRLFFGCILFSVFASMAVKPVRFHVKHICSEVDINGNVYVVTNSLELAKFTAGNTEKPSKQISVSNLGSDPVIDASNPLEIFLFYASTGKVAWFDNQLNIRGSADVFTAGITRPVAFGRANDGNIWVFDQNTQTLNKLDRTTLRVTQQSVIVRNLVNSDKPYRIFDNGDIVVFQDINGRLFLFDQNLVHSAIHQHDDKLLGMNGDRCVFLANDILMSCESPVLLRCDTIYKNQWDGRALHVGGDYFITADSTHINRFNLKQ